jgi:mxaJ protein
VRSFDDPALKRLRVGVQLIGDDYANSPPVHALARRGVVRNLRGYTIYGDYREDSPPARIIEAVARGDIDVAVAWGPLAGYFARSQGVPLEVVPVSPSVDGPFLPMVYDISLGVRRGDHELLNKLEAAMERRRDEVRRILAEYGVPDAGAREQTASR